MCVYLPSGHTRAFNKTKDQTLTKINRLGLFNWFTGVFSILPNIKLTRDSSEWYYRSLRSISFNKNQENTGEIQLSRTWIQSFRLAENISSDRSGQHHFVQGSGVYRSYMQVFCRSAAPGLEQTELRCLLQCYLL